MNTLSRRGFLRGSAALAASAALPPWTHASDNGLADLPGWRAAPGALPVASAASAAARGARLSDVDHIIVLMKENRSFDHYFGMLPGVRGFADRGAIALPGGRPVFEQPDPDNADGHVLPFRLDTHATGAQRLEDLNHSWGPLHGCLNHGAMDAFVTLHRKTDGAAGPLTMGYHVRDDIPLYYALADAFTVCDGYHCSVLGPTHPNRYFLMTGSIDADQAHGRAALDNSGRNYDWETYPERLTRAGVSWRIYHDWDDYGCNIVRHFAAYQRAARASELRDAALTPRPFYALLHDIATGNLPQVTWIVPPSDASEHPDYLPAAGEHHTHRILDALWSNPAVWAKTVLVINYDENDGQFDHVPPPLPPPGTPGEFVNGLPVGLGFRVPCLVVSPFSRGGYVVSDTFDHSSTLRLMEARFGVEVPNLSRWRRETCGDLTATLGLGEPARYDLPTLPDSARRLAEVEATVLTLPAPAVPLKQSMPVPEAATRPRRGSPQA